jgi:hypothetical protein
VVDLPFVGDPLLRLSAAKCIMEMSRYLQVEMLVNNQVLWSKFMAHTENSRRHFGFVAHLSLLFWNVRKEGNQLVA